MIARTGDAPVEAVFPCESQHYICEMLRSRRLRQVKDLVYVPSWELRDWLLVTEDEAEDLIARSWSACCARTCTAWELRGGNSDDLQLAAAVPAPLPSLGKALDGGLEGSFIEVAGPPNLGKTQFCLHLAAMVASRGGEVFWVDTERTFAPHRLLEIIEALCGGHGSDADQALQSLERVRCRDCLSLAELSAIVAELSRRASRGEELPALIVVDSIAAAARKEDGGDPLAASKRDAMPKRQMALNVIASMLKAVASAPTSALGARQPAVVVTNQVAGDPTHGGCRVTLGNLWHHAVNWRLVLSRSPPGCLQALPAECTSDRRFLFLEKSPCSAPMVIEYVIGAGGLSERSTSSH